MRVVLVAASALIALVVAALQWREGECTAAAAGAAAEGAARRRAARSAKEGGGGGNEPLRRDTEQLLPARRGGALWFVADSFTGRYLWDACRLWWRGRAGARAAARAAAKAAAKAA